MVFSSLTFIGIFLPVVLLCYYICKVRKYRNWVLLIASLFFYAWGEPIWVMAMVITAFVDYSMGRLMGSDKHSKRSVWPLVFSLVFDLGILFIFKYSAFVLGGVNQLLGVHLPMWTAPMPIGISFYTFQSLSYVIDVYRGKAEVQRSYSAYLMYVAMFPQLVAGPIVRYVDIALQINERKETLAGFAEGIKRFAIGMGKKVILANQAGLLAGTLLDGGRYSMLSAWVGILFFAFQIYFDFSGYSDMAIGLGKMFGFDYKENFNYPYISQSITEFWRRWHISLGSFFRDYVYIPLGGKYHHQLRNVLVVWFLTGFWHGANWNFISWGLYYGLLLLVEKILIRRQIHRIPVVSYVLTMLLVLYGWALFYFTDFTQLAAFTQAFLGMVPSDPIASMQVRSVLIGNLWFLLVCCIASTPFPAQLYKRMTEKWPAADHLRPVLMVGVLAAAYILLIGQSYNPFLYFRF